MQLPRIKVLLQVSDSSDQNTDVTALTDIEYSSEDPASEPQNETWYSVQLQPPHPGASDSRDPQLGVCQVHPRHRTGQLWYARPGIFGDKMDSTTGESRPRPDENHFYSTITTARVNWSTTRFSSSGQVL